MKEYVWKHKSKEWIKENPGKPTMYKEYIKDIPKQEHTPIEYTKPKSLMALLNKKEKDLKDAGIYLIMCEASNKIYVGQSISMDNRLRNHKMQICRHKDTTSKPHIEMRVDFLKHGMEAFKFVKYKPLPYANLETLLKEEKATMIEFMKDGYTLYNSDMPTNLYCEEEIKPIITKLLSKVSKNPELIEQIKALID